MSDFKTPPAGTPVPDDIDARLDAAIARQKQAQEALDKIVSEKDSLLEKAKVLVSGVSVALMTAADAGAVSVGAGQAIPLIHAATQKLVEKAVQEITKHQSDAIQKASGDST